MAFSGIAGLVAAVGAGATGVAMATAVLAAVANVGMIMTVVGAVTGNESLMKIGGVLSLVGGVGGAIAGATSGAAGAAAGAGLEGAAESAFTEAGTSLASDIGSNGLSALESTMSPGELMNGMTGTVGQTATEALGAPVSSGILNSAAPTSEVSSVAPPQVADVPASSQGSLGNVEATTNRIAGATDVKTPYDALTQSDMDVGAGMKTMGPRTPLPGSAIPSSSWWSTLGDNTKGAIIKSGTGLLQGAAQGKNQEEQNAIARARVQQTAYGSAVPKGVLKGAPA